MDLIFEDPKLHMLYMLASRLERISADSRWAHRASGLRGNILRAIDEISQGFINPERLDMLIQNGFTILENAAREYPGVHKDLEGRSH